MLKQTMLACWLVVSGCGPKPDFEPFDVYAAGETAVYGYVTDLYSFGLEAAELSVRNSDLGSVTNNRGQYRLRLMALNTYVVTVEKDGFAVDSATVQVGPLPLRHDFSLVTYAPCEDEPCPPYRLPCPANLPAGDEV